MRPTTMLRATLVSSSSASQRCAIAGPSTRPAIAYRSFTSSSPTQKKSKAAAAKRAHKQTRDDLEEETGENPDAGRYEAAPNDDLDRVLEKGRERMRKATDWAKAQVYEGVERVSGKVSPSLLDSVRVTMSEAEGSHPLSSVASVTVRKGSIWVDVWDAASMKEVESAINAANLPGVSPIHMSDTSLKIPVAKPTFEHRAAILKQLAQIVETAKSQVRKARTDGVNTLGGRGEPGADDVDKVYAEFRDQLDETLVAAKKAFEKV